MSLHDKTSQAMNQLFDEVSRFSVIALTGRTGSGCSTAARLLTSKKLPLPEIGLSHFQGNEARKYRIIKEYIDKKWTPFEYLQIKSIITKFILRLEYDSFSELVVKVLNKPNIKELLLTHKEAYCEMHEKTKNHEDDYELYYKDLPKYAIELRELLNKLSDGAYTAIFQCVGDNIRASGQADKSDFFPEKIFDFAKEINNAIKCVHKKSKDKNEKCLVVIDAIRNPYEALYLRERYSDFYVIAVNTSNENRLKHLKSSHKFTDAQITGLDQKEYPKSLKGESRFTSQDIQRCIELADIHINNPRDDLFGEAELASQLAWYISLIMHPGLVMPTSMETCMQIAYSAKKSSGCISRQVGAVVTDSGFSIKSVGWNNSPQGQVPCLLRSAKHLINGIDTLAYSKYERNDQNFRDVIKNKFESNLNSDNDGLNLSFCFKDIQNEVDGEKNQVHTRSLHAEENAFLQISKHGGQPIAGGFLFTTASPCELCAKKAFQLGIAKIYYIDPYPGIATSHVLEGGQKKPELILFRGAIGTAFHKLYQPLIPFKDELELKFSLSKNKRKSKTDILDQKNSDLNRENSELRRENNELQNKIKELELRLETNKITVSN